jgi:hypothetical protein
VIGVELGTINMQLYAVTLIANRISALGLIGSAITAVHGMTIIETVVQNAALNAQVNESCTIRAG